MMASIVRHWSRFEWYGLGFYLGHCWRTLSQIYKQDLSPLKIAFAVPSFGIAFWLWSDSVAYKNVGFFYISQIMPENVLGAVFFLHGWGLTWRVLALSRQIVWSMLFGAIGMVVYFGYPVFVWIDLHNLTGSGICMVGWGLVATWCTARLGTGEDRSGP